jgi:hypothetical protein
MTNLKVFYHVTNLPNWREIADEQMARLSSSGLLENAEVHINLNYDWPSSNEWRSLWHHHANIKWHFFTGPWMECEHPTFQLMQETVKSSNEDCYALYWHQKGITAANHEFIPLQHSSRAWRRYLDWFNVVNWRKMVEKLDEGCWDTVGVERQTAGDINYQGNLVYNYAGSICWYNSKFLKRVPTLKLPSTVDYKSQTVPGRRYRDDVEYLCGWYNDRGYSFYHSGRDLYQYAIPEQDYINIFNSETSHNKYSI